LVKTISFDDAYQLLENGKIISAIPIIAIQWLKINRDILREKWL
jgi:ADP-ribose pyrophosphatase